MIVVVRHGRTVSNAAGLLLGRADPDLDELGIDQARRLGAALGHEAGPAVDRIVTSPLARTRQTAAAVAAATGAAVTVDERFVELDYGEWDQRPLADVAADEWAAWRADVAFAPPGGESLAELGRRVRSGLDDLAEEARDRTIVVVTHVSPIKAAVAWAVGGTDEMAWRMFVAPASITRIATSVGAPSLHTFNDCSHLTG
ncbi:MAG: histidine phosphatase family protein [Microthrixaceae bacterium]|jgi:broad specificity phosphatase PhoE